MRLLLYVGVLALLTCGQCMKLRTELRVNPIQRVLSMLQIMAKTAEKEHREDQKLFDKYMCYCQKTDAELSKAITDAKEKVAQLQSDLEAGNAEKSQLATDIAQAQDAKESAEKTLAEAKAVRTKEAESYAREKAENAADLAAMDKALAALKKGAGASFLQSPGASMLRRFLNTIDLPEWDRRTMASFLSEGQRSDDSQAESYEPDVQDVLGIVSQMRETLGKDMDEADAAEKKAVAAYESLVATKKKELAAITKDLENKNARQGELSLDLATKSQELMDTSKMLEGDQTFQAELGKGCQKLSADWDHRSKTRQDEQQAIADTIKILNDDRAKHMMTKTFPTTSLVQVQRSSRELMRQARRVLARSGAKGPDVRLKLIAMAMKGRKPNFDHVLSLIEKMINLLGKEQKDDDTKKQYCTEELRKAEDEKTELKESASDIHKSIANSKLLLAATKEDISKMTAGLKDLDQAVKEATELRKKENTAYTEELASNNAAVNILDIAKNRLAQFYAPQLYQSAHFNQINESKGTPKAMQVVPVQQERTAASKVMEVQALEDAFSFLQQTSSGGAAPPPPPPTFTKPVKKDNAVLALLNTLIGDVKKQIEEMKTTEQDAQFEYEQFVKDSKEKLVSEAKALTEKELAKAHAEVALQKHVQELKTVNGHAAANDEYLVSLHKECDWMLEHFKVRRDARTSEIDALNQAKAVLSGADLSFLQVQRVKYGLRGSDSQMLA